MRTPSLTTNQRIARAWALLAVLGLVLGLTTLARGADRVGETLCSCGQTTDGPVCYVCLVRPP